MFANCHVIKLIMCLRNGRSEGIQRACLVSFLMKFRQEAGPETELRLNSAHHTVHLWNCEL